MSNSTIENTNWGNFSKSFQGIVEKVSQPKVWACAATAAGFVAATTTAVAFAAPAAAMACFTAAIVSAVSALIFATIAGVIWAVQHYKNTGDDGQSRIHEKQPNDSGGATFSEQAMGAENGAHITRDQHQSENVDGGTPFVLKPQPQPHTTTADGGTPWAGPISDNDQEFYDGLTPEEQTFYRTLSQDGRKIYKDLKESWDGCWTLYMFLYNHEGWENLEHNEMRRIVEELPQKFKIISTSDLAKIGFDDSHPVDWASFSHIQILTIDDDMPLDNLHQIPNPNTLTLHINHEGSDIRGIKDVLLEIKNVEGIVLHPSLKKFGFTFEEIRTMSDHGNGICCPNKTSKTDFLNELFGPQAAEDTDDVRIRYGKNGEKYQCYLDPDGHLKLDDATKVYEALKNAEDGSLSLSAVLKKYKNLLDLNNGEMRKIVEALPEKFYSISTDELREIGFDENSPLDLSKCKKLYNLVITELGGVTNLNQAPKLKWIYIDPANNDVQGIREFLLTVKNGKKIVLQSSLEQFQFKPNDIKTIIDHGNEIHFSSKRYSDEAFMTALFGPAKEGSEDTDRVRIRTGEDGKKYKFYLNYENSLNVEKVIEQDHQL